MQAISGNLAGLLVEADKTFYRAKQTGRNRVCLAESLAPDGERRSA